MVFGTDATIAKFRWHVYLDDRSFFPPYDLRPCVRRQVLNRHPEIAHALDGFLGTFIGGGKDPTPQAVSECQKAWQELNSKVDINYAEPDEVALEYLITHGLVEE
jgi:glycine betaine/choline ABC-type transport system substrate-binding protein